MPMKGWQPEPNKHIIQDPWFAFTGSKKAGGTTPSWGQYAPGEEYGAPSDVGYTGEGAPKFKDKTTQPSVAPWERWQPYFEGLGIHILPSGGMTATSKTFRSRMLPEALQAMMDYYKFLDRPWEDYVGYSQRFMPRTPTMGARSWRPSGLWRR